MNLREWALPVYTILQQLAAGALLVLWVIRAASRSKFNPADIDRVNRNPILVIAFTVGIAMLGAHLHLSRPLLSFLAVLNFRSSWLSREIVFTVFFFFSLSSLWLLSRSTNPHRKLISAVGWLGVGLGLTVIYCMGHIYLLPTQVAWNSPTTIISFYNTMVLLGTMTIACLLVLDMKFAEIQKPGELPIHNQLIRASFPWLALIAVMGVVFDFAINFYQMYYLQHGNLIAQTSLRLLIELYSPLLIIRFLFLIVASVWLGYTIYHLRKGKSSPEQLATPVYFSCLLVLVAEIIGRFLFYATHIRIGL
jgi:anaerobic dimethyl sulfoxide reductase subunit C (anchor subunit)